MGRSLFMDERDPEARTQEEIHDQAELAPDDPDTSREELELTLMEQGESEEGESIG
jgi:hypothetical protein